MKKGRGFFFYEEERSRPISGAITKKASSSLPPPVDWANYSPRGVTESEEGGRESTRLGCRWKDSGTIWLHFFKSVSVTWKCKKKGRRSKWNIWILAAHFSQEITPHLCVELLVSMWRIYELMASTWKVSYWIHTCKITAWPDDAVHALNPPCWQLYV